LCASDDCGMFTFRRLTAALKAEQLSRNMDGVDDFKKSLSVGATFLTPSDEGWTEALEKGMWNKDIARRRPGYLVKCANAGDVQVAVKFARKNPKLRIAVRGGGHSCHAIEEGEDVIVVDLFRMNGVMVDVGGKRVMCGGGARYTLIMSLLSCFVSLCLL